MIYLAFVLVIFALVALVAWQQQQFGLRDQAWARERSVLLTRIQHPEVVAAEVDIEGRVADLIPAQPIDEIDLVGTVQGGDNGD